MNKKYLVFDLETSGKSTFKRFCNPLDPRHSITMVALKLQGEDARVEYNKDDYEKGVDVQDVFKNVDLDSVKFICGQNVKFDLLYCWENKDLQRYLAKGGAIWDTQTVQYLLDGQRNARRNLDTLAQKYGGKIKDDRIGVMFSEGLESKDIDPEILGPYAKGDVENTELVLKGQARAVSALGLFPLLKGYMDHYLALTEMEYNGLYIDLDTANRLQKKYEKIVKDYIDTIKREVGDEEFNPMSNHQVSKFLYGAAGRPVDKKVLGAYTQKYPNTKKARVISKILELRESNKILTTYIYSEEFYKRANKVKGIQKGDLRRTTGLKSLVMPHSNAVHSEFYSAITRTGRLASRNPNIQNLPPDVLEMFCSRWGDEGAIVEFDYSQLEVVIQAQLTNCTKMIEDIKNGVDFHCKRLAYAEDMPYEEVKSLCDNSPEWKLKRKKAKTISFQKAYGAMPQKIADESGLPLETVEKIFQKEDEEYPEIEEFHRNVEKIVKNTRTPTDELADIYDKKTNEKVTREGVFKAFGTYQSPTGKLYSFDERAVVTKTGKVFRYFKRPDIQDYPVQGTAADIVAFQVGKVFRKLQKHRSICRLINEVHDSLILDVKKEHLDWTIETVRSILEDVDSMYRALSGGPFMLPVKVSVSCGKTWKDCKEEAQ